MPRGRPSRSTDLLLGYSEELRRYQNGERKTRPRPPRVKRKFPSPFQRPSFEPDPKSPSVHPSEGELVTPLGKWPELADLRIFLQLDEPVDESKSPDFEYTVHSLLELIQEINEVVNSENLKPIYPTLRELSWYLNCCHNFQSEFETINFLFDSKTQTFPKFVSLSDGPLSHESYCSAAVFCGNWLCNKAYWLFDNIVAEREEEWPNPPPKTEHARDCILWVKKMIRKDIADLLRQEFKSIDLGSLLLGARKELNVFGQESREAVAYRLYMPGNLSHRQVFERIAAMAKKRPELRWPIPKGESRVQDLFRATQRWAASRQLTSLPRRQARKRTKRQETKGARKGNKTSVLTNSKSNRKAKSSSPQVRSTRKKTKKKDARN